MCECNLEELQLNEGLRGILEQAIAHNNLKELVLPSSLKIIGERALYGTFRPNAYIYVKSENILMIHLLSALYDAGGYLEIVFPSTRKRVIQDEWNKLRIELNVCSKNGFDAYNIFTHSSFLEHVVVRFD